MKNQKMVLLGLFAVLIFGLIFFLGKRTPIASNENPRRMEDQRIGMIQRQTEVPEVKKTNTTITVTEIKSFKETLPDKLKVKEEFTESPHSTPASLRKFANTMGPLMEKALKNGDDAGILINELNDCALDDSVAHAARATCVINSERLAKNYPTMKTKAGEIRANVDPDVKKMLDTRDRFIKK